MVWRKFTIHTTTEAEDILSANLADLGLDGVQIEDKIPLSEEDTKGMFIDILPDMGPDDGLADVSFYVEVLDPEAKQDRMEKAKKYLEDPSVDASYMPNTSNVYTPAELKKLLEDVEEMISDMRNYCNVGSGSIETSETEDKDWINNWKTFFHPFTVGDILIKPTWEEVPEEHKDKLLIEIDPGTAFGTGMHETTQLCIRQIQKYMKKGSEVADIGTGSGILGITALKLGAGHIYGTDLDEEAVPAVHDNLKANGLSEESFDMVVGNVIGDEAVKAKMGLGKYDIVVANILAPVIVLLTGEVGPLLHKDGLFITSGILNEREQEVLEAFKAHEDTWEVLEVNHQGEWVNVTARRK
ncbi:ribosomal protein L11 methyltransferase [Lachnospiraceae bacterium JC7]|nr:ribosomal protein L11 methyltransferase [Lachnospiraceae bacterium JC7]